MHRKFLEKWLRDAYAMERAAIEILEKQVDRLEDYPQARTKIQQHLQQTEWQASQVERCLQRLGTKPSAFKDFVAKTMANMSVLTNATAEDEVLKNFIANASFENMEIASYRSLMAAAEDCGETEIHSICEQILRQEEDMAVWCEENIESATKQFLNLQHAET